jgi:hypothetical protein
LTPANRWLRLFAKSGDQHTENEMALSKTTLEYVEKSALSAKAKAACKEALEKLGTVKSELPKEQWKAFRKAFAFEEQDDEDKEDKKKSADELATLKKSATEAVDALVSAKATAKSAVNMLEGETPDIAAAVTALAPVAGVTPKGVLLAHLPPEIKVQFEELKKSAAASQVALEEMRLAARRGEFVQKAAAYELPGKAEDLAAIMMAMPAETLPQFMALLDTVKPLVQKSIGLELGTSVAGAAWARQGGESAATGVYAKVCEIADQMVQKSDGKLTKEAARVKVLMERRDLAVQLNAEQTATRRPQ